MTQLEPSEILKRSELAWALKDQWRSVLEDAYDMALAGVSPYGADKDRPRSMARQFDSTAPNGVVKLANRILMELTPPHEDWVNIKTGPVLDMKYKDQKQVLENLKKELDGASSIMNMIVNHGDTVTARHQAYVDVVISGMGVILDLEDAHDDVNPINSQCVSQSEVALEKDAKGRNSGIFRKRTIKVRNVQSTWADAVMPKELLDMMKNKKSVDPEIDVIEVTYHRGYDVDKTKKRNTSEWYYEVLWTQGGKNAVRLVERMYDENPWTVFQWMILPGCVYGPGPVLLALPDIRTANKIVEMILMNAALALAGMYMAKDDGIFNPDTVVIGPGNIIPVSSTGGNIGASLVPLSTNREFDIGQIVLKEYQDRIRRWLFDVGLEAPGGKVVSAAEIINRVRAGVQDLGAGLLRLISDHDNYVRRKFSILIKRGIIPFDIKIDQFTFRMQINSPLARARQLQKVQTVIEWVETVNALGGPQAVAVAAKIPEIAAWIADAMGVPKELANTEDERQKIQENMAKIAASTSLPQQATGAIA